MTIHRNMLILGALLLAACSKNSGDRSTGGSGGTGSLAQQLCPDACKTVKTCYAALDTGACETQCGKELGGDGYLIPEFAKEYFQKLKDVGTDKSCTVTHLEAWSPPPGENVDADVMQDPSATKPCVDAVTNCTGKTPRADVCFLAYYIYNTPYREKMKPCYALSCAAEGSCLCDAAVPWLAWDGIPRDPNDFVHGKCPPTD